MLNFVKVSKIERKRERERDSSKKENRLYFVECLFSLLQELSFEKISFSEALFIRVIDYTSPSSFTTFTSH